MRTVGVVTDQLRRRGHPKIAVVTDSFPQPSETFILDHVTSLIDRGCDVSVVGSPPATGTVVHESYFRYGLENEVIVRREPRSRAGAFVRCAVESAKVVARRESVGRLVDRYRSSPARAAALLRELPPARAIAGHDLVHCHYGWNGRRMADALEVVGGRVPLVTTFHGSDVSRMLEEEGPRLYDSLFERGNVFLTVSEYFRQRLLGLGAPPERTIVHHMGVDTAQWAGIPAPPSRSGKPLKVLSAARLVEKKGLEFALRAVARCLAEGVEVTYVIVGDGPLRKDLESLSRRLGLAETVRFLGMLDRDAFRQQLAWSDVLLAPSVTAVDGNMEGIPVVLMEAMAAGRCAVSTVHSGIPELVTSGVSGLLAEERNVEHLVEHLTALFYDRSQIVELGSAARRVVREQFDADILADDLVRLYSDIIQRSVS